MQVYQPNQLSEILSTGDDFPETALAQIQEIITAHINKVRATHLLLTSPHEDGATLSLVKMRAEWAVAPTQFEEGQWGLNLYTSPNPLDCHVVFEAYTQLTINGHAYQPQISHIAVLW